MQIPDAGVTRAFRKIPVAKVSSRDWCGELENNIANNLEIEDA
jgi:hypothetical protein